MTDNCSTDNAANWGRLNSKFRSSQNFEPRRKLRGCEGSYLPYGNGRSYGDTCHNDQGILLDNKHNKSILSFNNEQGILSAETGILLSDILNYLADTQWFLPVVPGTKFVTLGGAIANDIHGKNHEVRGTFGCHVRSLTLWRSNGEELDCNLESNADLFRSTIAGMGLTGVIIRAEIQLMKVPSHFITQTTVPFGNLGEFFEKMEKSKDTTEYSVAWVDSLARGKAFGRGIMITGKHAPSPERPVYRPAKISIPFVPPVPLVSGLPLQVFNSAYFWRNASKKEDSIVDPNSFFFPLDAVGNWNRLYGPKGLYQHQSVFPENTAESCIRKLLRASQLSGHGSFLTVLKRFGEKTSPGYLSFPKSGFTLTLDFPNKGTSTRALLNQLDRIVLQAGGRTNPYKDARMSAQTFQTGFPDWKELEELRDPAIQSDFWRRVTGRPVVKPPAMNGDPQYWQINQSDKPEIQNSDIKFKSAANSQKQLE